MLFVFEAKASPVREPFRDPIRAHERIRGDFRETIQKAYEQANRVRTRLLNSENVDLYSSTGEHLTTLLASEIDRIYCVCVTSDNFGPVATNLPLLQKPSTEEFPWAVSYLDLETILNGFTFRGWGPDQLCNFLDQRLKLYGRLVASDELEPAGIYLKEGSLERLLSLDVDQVVLGPDTSQVFDEIWKEKNGGAKANFEPNKLIVTDARELLNDGQGLTVREVLSAPQKRAKVGRNEPCPCGSGSKFKHCCGSHARNHPSL